jgi:hypothetical protein
MKNYLRARAHGVGFLKFYVRLDRQLCVACLIIGPAASTMLLGVCEISCSLERESPHILASHNS